MWPFAISIAISSFIFLLVLDGCFLMIVGEVKGRLFTASSSTVRGWATRQFSGKILLRLFRHHGLKGIDFGLSQEETQSDCFSDE